MSYISSLFKCSSNFPDPVAIRSWKTQDQIVRETSVLSIFYAEPDECYVFYRINITVNMTTSCIFHLANIQFWIINRIQFFFTPFMWYFRRVVLKLQQSTGLEDLGPIRWQLVGCTIFIFSILFASMRNGVKTSGKVNVINLFSMILCRSAFGRFLSFLYILRILRWGEKCED